ncbi:fimbria/pilus outer membrane usher protein [Escherichia coli]
MKGILVIPLRQGEYRSGNAQQEKPRFSRVHYSTAFRLAGQYMVERNWRIVIVLFNFGIGKNMGALGALSVDMTQANSTLPDDSQHDGQSVRILYNKSLNESGTNIQLVGYRYSTSGYF